MHIPLETKAGGCTEQVTQGLAEACNKGRGSCYELRQSPGVLQRKVLASPVLPVPVRAKVLVSHGHRNLSSPNILKGPRNLCCHTGVDIVYRGGILAAWASQECFSERRELSDLQV